MENFRYKDETFQIIGAAMTVHRILGCGFTEKVYQDALETELAELGVPYIRESPFHVQYKGKELNSVFIPDFICYNAIIVELKAVKELDDIHRSQAINYGKVVNAPISLLLNFGAPSLEYERFCI